MEITLPLHCESETSTPPDECLLFFSKEQIQIVKKAIELLQQIDKANVPSMVLFMWVGVLGYASDDTFEESVDRVDVQEITVSQDGKVSAKFWIKHTGELFYSDSFEFLKHLAMAE